MSALSINGAAEQQKLHGDLVGMWAASELIRPPLQADFRSRVGEHGVFGGHRETGHLHEHEPAVGIGGKHSKYRRQ